MQKYVALVLALMTVSLITTACNQTSDNQLKSSIEETNNFNTTSICEIDRTAAPQVDESARQLLQKLCEKDYSKIKEVLIGDSLQSPTKIPIILKEEPCGIAESAEGKIFLCSKWLTDNLNKSPEERDRELGGVLVHEMVHVVQDYLPHQLTERQWLVDGIADYIRYGVIYKDSEDKNPPTMNCSGGKHYTTDTYACAATFLNFILKEKPPEVLVKLNTALKSDKYDDAFFKDITGKPLDQLWQECLSEDCEGGRSQPQQ